MLRVGLPGSLGAAGNPDPSTVPSGSKSSCSASPGRPEIILGSPRLCPQHLQPGAGARPHPSWDAGHVPLVHNSVWGHTLTLSQPARESGPSTWWALHRLPSRPLACPSEGHPVNLGPPVGGPEALDCRGAGLGAGETAEAWGPGQLLGGRTCSGFPPAIHSRRCGSDSPFLIVKSSLSGRCTLNEMVPQPSAQ